MNSPPFDIGELRANIGSDLETERMLLAMFLETCGESLQLLEAQLPAENDAEYNALWKKHMHQIKGAALNLGAGEFSHLAAAAMQDYESAPDVKRKSLAEMRLSFSSIEIYIRQLAAAA